MRITSLNTEGIGHMVVRRPESRIGAIYVDLPSIALSRPKDVIAIVAPVGIPAQMNGIPLLILLSLTLFQSMHKSKRRIDTSFYTYQK